jgi:dethiobiotin synthetase
MKTKKTQFFLTGIGTGVGKTLTAALLTEALRADYWKPIQAGDVENTDTQTVQSLVSNPESRFFAERHALKMPASPHYAAAAQNINIELSDFVLPDTDRNLVVEGAGGLLVPISRKYLLIDLIKQLNLPVVLVVQHYLGAINHTLLSVEALRARQIPILGLVFNGENYNDNEEIILHYTGLPCLLRLPQAETVSAEWLQNQANQVFNTTNKTEWTFPRLF